MKLQQYTTPSTTFLHCSYEEAYESIYDSSYGACFVFYDEEELETDDGCSLIPSSDISPSGFFQRQH